MIGIAAEEDLISLEQAAARLSPTPLNVLIRIRQGALIGAETDHGWEVTAQSLAVYLRQRAEGTALVTCKSGCSNAGCGSCGSWLP